MAKPVDKAVSEQVGNFVVVTHLLVPFICSQKFLNFGNENQQ
jgi:hypothetical protein